MKLAAKFWGRCDRGDGDWGMEECDVGQVTGFV